MLPLYADRFPTVEINRSYYRLPDRTVFEGWRAQAPPGFLFAVKASRFLTHMKKLKDPEEPLERLMSAAAGLEEKLGPVLFQFPRQWRLNLERLDGFLPLLEAYRPVRFTFEFRHESWLVPAVYERLERTGCALCLPVGWGIPLDVRLTASWTYIRMHGGESGNAFSDEELRGWAERIADYQGAGSIRTSTSTTIRTATPSATPSACGRCSASRPGAGTRRRGSPDRARLSRC